MLAISWEDCFASPKCNLPQFSCHSFQRQFHCWDKDAWKWNNIYLILCICLLHWRRYYDTGIPYVEVLYASNYLRPTTDPSSIYGSDVITLDPYYVFKPLVFPIPVVPLAYHFWPCVHLLVLCTWTPAADCDCVQTRFPQMSPRSGICIWLFLVRNPFPGRTSHITLPKYRVLRNNLKYEYDKSIGGPMLYFSIHPHVGPLSTLKSAWNIIS